MDWIVEPTPEFQPGLVRGMVAGDEGHWGCSKQVITGRIDVSRHPLRAMNGHATTSAHGGPGPPHGTSILPCTTRIRTSPPYRRIHRNAGR
jgi:hypothetical protein